VAVPPSAQPLPLSRSHRFIRSTLQSVPFKEELMISEKITADSPQVMQTKNRMKQALLQLLQQKNVNQITIRELTQLSHLNRTTFYRYYYDIYDLYYDLLQDFVQPLQQHVATLLQISLTKKEIRLEDMPLQFLIDNQPVLIAFLHDPSMTQQIKTAVKDSLRAQLQLPADSPEIQYLLEYLTAGQINLLTYWIEQGMTPPLPDLFPLIQAILSSGPFTVLAKQISDLQAVATQ